MFFHKIVTTDENFIPKFQNLEKENKTLKTKIWHLNHKLSRVERNVDKLSEHIEYFEKKKKRRKKRIPQKT